MLRSILLILVCTLHLPLWGPGGACPCVRAQTLLELSELQQLAAQRAENVLIAGQQLEASSLNLDAFAAGLRPRLDLNANFPNYFRTSSEVTQEDGTIAFREIELNNSSVSLTASQRIAATGGLILLESRLQRTDNLVLDNKNYNGSPIRLGIRQPILAFNPWKWDRRLLPLQQQVDQASLKAARSEAALQATFLFFDLVDADQERRIAETNRAANQTLFSIAEERFELGQINRGDLVQLRLELVSARQNLLRAERLVGSASQAISDLLGEAYAGDLLQPALPDSALLADGALADSSRALSIARRPELLDARLNALSAEREVDRVRRELGPRMDLEAGFGLIRNDPELSPIYSDPQNERIVSLRLALPILDWGERKLRTKQAQTEVALARRLGENATNRLNGELVQLLEQWRTVRTELALAAELQQLAEERFRISQESYTLGAIPLAELTIAQQIRDQNTRAYARTLRAFWLTYARLARVTLWDFINDKPLS